MMSLTYDFRPNFRNLPNDLQELTIVTQNEIIKSELPSNLRKLTVSCPNSTERVFYPGSDNFDLYRINFEFFGKYNVFEGGYFHDDKYNIKNWLVQYHYSVRGDVYNNDIDVFGGPAPTK